MTTVANYRIRRGGGVDLLDAQGNSLGSINKRSHPAAWDDYLAWLRSGTQGEPHVPQPPVSPPPATDADDAYLLSARRRIDAAAGQACMRFVTVAPAQDARYTAKYASAQAFIAAGYPTDASAYPWISRQATHTGQTAAQVADEIIAVGDPWHDLVGPEIEAVRIAGKRAIAALGPNPTRAAVDAVVTATLAALAAIQPPA